MVETTALRKQQLDGERQAVRARVVRMRRRLAEDRKELKGEAARLVGSESPLAEHPRAILVGGVAAGFLLGKTAPSLPPPAHPATAFKHAADRGTHAVTGVAKVQAGLIVKDFLAGAFGRSRGPVSEAAQQ